jgi:hypothetical protein
MSDTMRFNADCSYCYRGIKHDIKRHDDSVALAARWNRMCVAPAAPPSPADKRWRLHRLRERRCGLIYCIKQNDRRLSLRYEESYAFLHRELEITSADIARLETELEEAE